ncbi:MAG: hypothetical protein L0Z55_11615 [Planctomycetes bacterium]|nr:hypothetical protein [Planctomycetota bacterium]
MSYSRSGSNSARSGSGARSNNLADHSRVFLLFVLLPALTVLAAIAIPEISRRAFGFMHEGYEQVWIEEPYEALPALPALQRPDCEILNHAAPAAAEHNASPDAHSAAPVRKH